MAAKVKPVPQGFHSVNVHLAVRDAARAIEWYRQAFGAEELFRMADPAGGGVLHAEIRIGDAVVMLCEERPDGNRSPLSLGGSPVTIALYVEDADATFDRAVRAGATPTMPVADMFWGDRYGRLRDPFGHEWSVATHREDLTPEEIGRRAAKFFEEMAAAS